METLLTVLGILLLAWGLAILIGCVGQFYVVAKTRREAADYNPEYVFMLWAIPIVSTAFGALIFGLGVWVLSF